MKPQSHDILAKLLATENITVVRKNTHTASFDIVNRVLTLPTWKNLSDEVEEMLVLHEVGHALYTTMEGYGSMYKTAPHLRGYANVIEDVRIERKMKQRYPGCRKSFNIGYTQLNEKDFFEIEGKDLSEYILIDRINIFYKVGYNANVPFTSEEYEFVRRAEQCETEDDVLELANDIYEFSKEQKELEEEELYAGLPEEEEDDEDSDTLTDGSGRHPKNSPENYLDPLTVNAFEKNLGKHEDAMSRTYYFEPKFEVEYNEDIIVPYKKCLDQMISLYDSSLYVKHKAKAMEFKQQSTNIVNYLVKEFEMRKSASAYKRSKISKLGQIDPRKLFAYQLKDDIFKQITTVQEGKKHGMIFLLDWSGSMSNYMHETVEQVISLVMFCRKIDIPYQVFAFTDGYDRHVNRIAAPKINSKGVNDNSDFTLLELFSHKMNTRDFNRMIEVMLANPWYRIGDYQLNSTPLNQALIYMADYIGKFIKQNDVEKMNLITLTDGESNGLCHYDKAKTGQGDIKSGPAYVYEDGRQLKVRVTNVMQDPITRKEYYMTEHAGQQTGMLLNLLKDRYGLRSVSFYITKNNFNNLQRFIKRASEDENLNHNASEVYRQAAEAHERMRKDKAAVLKRIPGRDELYIISSDVKIEDEDLENVNNDMSASQISRQLTKMFTSKKTSRVVLNSFIGQVA